MPLYEIPTLDDRTLAILQKREPGEPVFALLGRDPTTPDMVRIWGTLRRFFIKAGAFSDDQAEYNQIREALDFMTECECWHREYETRRKVAEIEANGGFDDRGIPRTGPHRAGADTKSV